MTWAPRFVPGIDIINSTAVRKGPRFASTCVSSVAIAASRASISVQMKSAAGSDGASSRGRRGPRGTPPVSAFTRRSARAAEFGGIGFAGNQCLDHCTATLAHQIGEHWVRFARCWRLSSVFCTPQHVKTNCSRTNCLRVRGRFEHLLGLRVRYEARPDQTVRQQFGQPHSIVDVGFARPARSSRARRLPASTRSSPSSKMCHTGFQ